MESYILVEHLNSLNAVISETFKSSKRIKLTSFDVSNKYIIFGASSGGIYIFKREPCEFVKLIPSKEGSASKILISPSEKNIAIASAKGLVIILENFLEFNLKVFLHSQHDDNTITEIKWNGNNVYCGDNTGKISMFSLTNLLTIFHTPSAVLMQLDSSIVQIDTYLNYLLVSTQTRTYLCDTEKEQYKQIGKKLRDGYFGACFFNITDNSNSIEAIHSLRGVYKTVTEDEHFGTSLSNAYVKVHCARPGARIWEVNFEATVLMTYQFRESLAQYPANILHITDAMDAKLNISTFENMDKLSPNFNFGKIYPICSRFIFTYSDEGIYFFDPKTSCLLMWSNNFKNIKDIKILNSVVYVWQNDLQIKSISLELLENLIIKTLLNKQYYLCAELCINYIEDVTNLLEKSEKLHLLSILEIKLPEIEATHLLEPIKSILCKLEEYKKGNIANIISRIGLVDNVYKNDNLEECDYTPESVQNFDNNYTLTFDKNCSLKMREENELFIDINALDILHNNDNNFYEAKHQEYSSTQNTEEKQLISLYKQYQLNKSHKNVELTESSTLLEQLSLDSMLICFEHFIKYVENLDKTDATLWCKEQFLKQASRKIFDIGTVEQTTLTFLNETFMELNNRNNFVCKCQFPLPKCHKYPLEYYKLGCKIFQNLENPDHCLTMVPYLHKYKLSRIDNLNDFLLNLPLLTQFSDKSLFEQFTSMCSYDTWDEIVKLFIKLKQGVCLNCGEPIDLEGTWSWTNFGLLMIKSIGPKNTSRLLKRYSIHIPDGELGAKFYQCCIFSSTFCQPHLAVDFMEKVLCDSTSQKFEDLMEKFLHRKYLGYQSATIKCDEQMEVPKCVYCELPLNEPIINEIKKCDCGHSFHSLCLLSNNSICNVCTTT